MSLGFLPFPLPWQYHLLQKTGMSTPGNRTQLPSFPWAHEDSQTFGFVTENLLKAESKKDKDRQTDIGYYTAALMKKYFGLLFFSVKTLTSTAPESLR